jgi:hypothetical protein
MTLSSTKTQPLGTAQNTTAPILLILLAALRSLQGVLDGVRQQSLTNVFAQTRRAVQPMGKETALSMALVAAGLPQGTRNSETA